MVACTGLPACPAPAAAVARGRRLEVPQQELNLPQVVVHPTDMAARTVQQVNSNAPDYTAPSVSAGPANITCHASQKEAALMLHAPALMAWSRGNRSLSAAVNFIISSRLGRAGCVSALCLWQKAHDDRCYPGQGWRGAAERGACGSPCAGGDSQTAAGDCIPRRGEAAHHHRRRQAPQWGAGGRRRTPTTSKDGLSLTAVEHEKPQYGRQTSG